nr:hypothetical protein BaRGS_028955 [Batillaria attramentaria]
MSRKRPLARQSCEVPNANSWLPTGIGTQHSNNLTGTPPDLTLTVLLDNVTEKELGQWRLELTNDAGTGHVDFHLVTR